MDIQQNVEVQFLGPAKYAFDSFHAQSAYFLDTFCTNWRDYEHPQNHIIPPSFHYKRSEVSDEAVLNVRKRYEQSASINPKKRNHVIQDRLGDEAEHMMHRAISRAIHAGFEAPFVAMHNFKIDDRRLKLLKLIFPNIPWHALEYDFILIGPKIGVVVIEVKSSKFTNEKILRYDCSYLPNDYTKGLSQLNSFEYFLELVKRCTRAGVEMPTESILQVLMTPNLSKETYSKWRSNTTEQRHERVVHIFKEDMVPSGSEELPSVFEAFQNLRFPKPISSDIYEAYAFMLAGLSSAISFAPIEPAFRSLPTVTLDSNHLSVHLTIVSDSAEVAQQNQIGSSTTFGECSRQPHKDSLLVKADSDDQTKSACKIPIILLTPEQQEALKGPNHQVVIGPAGTGKTMILQAKALQLLKDGESVIVISPVQFRPRYKLLFDAHQYKNYEIFRWSAFVAPILTDGDAESSDDYEEDKRSDSSDVETAAEDRIENENSDEAGQESDSDNDEEPNAYDWPETEAETIEVFRELRKNIDENPSRYTNIVEAFDHKHVLIDDTFCEMLDDDAWQALSILLAIAKPLYFERTIWIAYDPYQFHVGLIRYDTQIRKRNFLVKFFELCEFLPIELKRIMRCSEEVYREVYNDDLLDWKMFMAGKLAAGHKTQGILPRKIEKHFARSDEAWNALANEVLESIRKMQESHQSKTPDFIGVLITTSGKSEEVMPQSFNKILESSYSSIDAIDIEVSHEENRSVEKMHCFNYYLVEEHKLYQVRNCVIVARTNAVPSFEWPVVIHAVCIRKSDDNTNDIKAQRYLARSRAIATFCELFFTFDEIDVVNNDKSE